MNLEKKRVTLHSPHWVTGTHWWCHEIVLFDSVYALKKLFSLFLSVFIWGIAPPSEHSELWVPPAARSKKTHVPWKLLRVKQQKVVNCDLINGLLNELNQPILHYTTQDWWIHCSNDRPFKCDFFYICVWNRFAQSCTLHPKGLTGFGLRWYRNRNIKR